MIYQLLIATLLSVLALVACAPEASSLGVSSAPVPAALEFPSGYKAALQVSARGVQIYTCQPKADAPTTLEWSFKAPEASLYDANGTPFGSHGAGPFWASTDGSRIVGEVVARVNSSDGTAIAWLLLKTKSVGEKGSLSDVVYVQRLDTVAGKAPADGCGTATQNTETRVPYTARYVFATRAP